MIAWAKIMLGLLAMLLAASALAASDRVALVIGNGQYEVGQLANPVNDASDVAAALERLGFEVRLGTNLGREEMLRELAEFRRSIQPGGLALVFYAGHAVEVDGQNWLLPVRNRGIGTQADVPIYSVSAQDILRKVEEGGARLNLLVLDACRDNPLPAGSRSASRGLGTIATGSSTLVAYSTAPGKVAADGSGRNSPYTQALLEVLEQGELSVTDLFNRVGASVMQRTGGAQVPWNSNTPIWPPIYLTAAGVGKESAQPRAPAAPEGQLAITVSPAGARIYINEALVGTGEQRVSWAAGQSVSITARAPGYADANQQVLVQAGRVTDVGLALAIQRESFEPEMVTVPAGRFRMGSPDHEEGRKSTEGPVHEVSLESFQIGRYAVTFDEWGACVAVGACAFQGFDLEWGRGRRPVLGVSWEDAQAYVAWLNQSTLGGYRLPSEAEWEYAARAGTRGPFSFDGPAEAAKANYDSRHLVSGEKKWGFWHGFRDQTVEVGSLPANPWGLHEVYGNVSEWVEDCWHDNYQGAPGDGSAWISDCTRDTRVLRGGSWMDPPREIRAAARSWASSPARRDPRIGFRLARTLPGG